MGSAVASRQTEDHVTRAYHRDRDALEELYLEHFDRIYSYLHMTVGNRHDAEDLTTQTFLKMLESIGKFRWGTAPFWPGSSGSRTTWRSITSARGGAGNRRRKFRSRPARSSPRPRRRR